MKPTVRCQWCKRKCKGRQTNNGWCEYLIPYPHKTWLEPGEGSNPADVPFVRHLRCPGSTMLAKEVNFR